MRSAAPCASVREAKGPACTRKRRCRRRSPARVRARPARASAAGADRRRSGAGERRPAAPRSRARPLPARCGACSEPASARALARRRSASVATTAALAARRTAQRRLIQAVRAGGAEASTSAVSPRQRPVRMSSWVSRCTSTGATPRSTPELERGGVAQVDDARAVKGAAVVDAHHDLAAIGGVAHAGVARDRHGAVRRAHRIHVVDLAAGGGPAVELAAVPGGQPGLEHRFVGRQRRVALAQHLVGLVRPAAADGLDTRLGIGPIDQVGRRIGRRAVALRIVVPARRRLARAVPGAACCRRRPAGPAQAAKRPAARAPVGPSQARGCIRPTALRPGRPWPSNRRSAC